VSRLKGALLPDGERSAYMVVGLAVGPSREVSRVVRGILPLVGEALCLHVPGLEQAIRGRLVLVDGTDVPTGNRAGQEISSLRSAIERCTAHLKNWKILATGYRGRLAELPTVIRIVTALEFYRLDW
jgi:hypothetical protein